MVRTIKITTGCRVSVTELPDWDLKERAKELDAEFIEIVRTKRMYELFRNPVVMMVDDSGLIRNKPVNPFASFLYAEYGGIIAGDVLLGIQQGPDILPPDDPEGMLRFLTERFPALQKGR